MRVLGIDPGSRHLGWGIVEARGSRYLHIASGTLSATNQVLQARLVALARGLREIVVRHAPTASAIERVFHGKNVHSALTLAHARGIALLVTGERDLAISEYTACQIKQAVVGRGRATKEQVQAMVQIMLGVAPHREAGEAHGFDTTDALAAAICHLQCAGSLYARAERRTCRAAEGVSA